MIRRPGSRENLLVCALTLTVITFAVVCALVPALALAEPIKLDGPTTTANTKLGSSGPWLVWANQDGVVAYNTVSGERRSIPGASNPSVDGGRIVYDRRMDESALFPRKICVYDLTAGVETALTGDGDCFEPDVSGGVVVWVRRTDGSGWYEGEIWAQRLGISEAERVSPEGVICSTPHVGDGRVSYLEPHMQRPHIKIVSAEGGDPVQVGGEEVSQGTGYDFDGRFLVSFDWFWQYVWQSGGVRVYDTQTGSVHQTDGFGLGILGIGAYPPVRINSGYVTYMWWRAWSSWGSYVSADSHQYTIRGIGLPATGQSPFDLKKSPVNAYSFVDSICGDGWLAWTQTRGDGTYDVYLEYEPDVVPPPQEPDAEHLTAKPVVLLINGLNNQNDGEMAWLRNHLVESADIAWAEIVPSRIGATEEQGVDSAGNLDDQVGRLSAWLLANSERLDGHRLVLVGHSYGGVIARGLVSKSFEGELKQSGVATQVAGVIQLGSPNKGSMLARVANDPGDFDAQAKIILDSMELTPSNATFCLDPDWMDAWGDRVGTTSVPVYRLYGSFLPTALDAAGISGDDYHLAPDPHWMPQWGTCEGVLRKFHDILGKVASDGIVTASSAMGKSRYFGSGSSIDVGAMRHGAEVPGRELRDRRHSDMVLATYPSIVPWGWSNPVAWAITRKINQSGSSTALDRSTRASAGGEAGAEPASRWLIPRQLTLAAGGEATTTVVLDGSPTVLHVNGSGAAPSARLVRSGEAIDQHSKTFFDPGANTGGVELRVDGYEPGEYMLELSSDGVVGGTFHLSGLAEAGPTMEVSILTTEPVCGEPIVVQATLDHSGTPVSGVNVRGQLSQGGTSIPTEMHDDGIDPDTTGSDGVYSASVVLPDGPGPWHVRATAGDASFERADFATFSAGTHVWAGFVSSAEVTECLGPADTVGAWGLGADIEASVPGTYRLSCEVSDSMGKVLVRPSSTATLSAESTRLTCWSDGGQLSTAAPGSLSVSNIRLHRATPDGLLFAGSLPDFQTREYSPDEFYDFSVSLEPQFTNPSPTTTVPFSGTTRYTPGGVVRVDYSLDGGSTWTGATPSDGYFSSSVEEYDVPLSLLDGVYGLLVRAQASDGATLPPAAWAGTRFTVDTIAPGEAISLAVSRDPVDRSVWRASWIAPQDISPISSAVRYSVAVDSAPVGETYGTTYDLLLPSDSATHSVSVLPVDEAGNAGPASTVLVAPPAAVATTATGTPEGWTRNEVTVSLSATGGVSPLSTRYRFADGEWEQYESPLAVTEEGTTTIEYMSEDALGAREDTRSTSVCIDKTPPATGCDSTATYVSAATVSLVASDALSGVSSTRWSIDGGAWHEGSVAATDTRGVHLLEYLSSDNAGNVEDTATVTFTVLKSTSLTLRASASSCSYGNPVTLSARLSSPARTGKALVLERRSGSAWVAVATRVTDAGGGASVKVTPLRKTSYRIRFADEPSDGLLGCVSPAVTITPGVKLTVPVAPSRVTRRRPFSVYGYLKPRHTAGTSAARLQCYRRQSGRWVLRKTVSVKASNYYSYSKYSARLSLPYSGRWRLRVYHVADSSNGKTCSGYRYVSVR